MDDLSLRKSDPILQQLCPYFKENTNDLKKLILITKLFVNPLPGCLDELP